MKNILVVDDDHHIADVICFALEKAGYCHVVARDGSQALALVKSQPFDLIVLDVGLPEMDGLEVCRQVRKSSEIPILFLSARDEEIDRILGLEIGGDDYVTKPFSPRELIARISVILKRVESSSPAEIPSNNQLNTGDLLLDVDHRSVLFKGEQLKLTALEFNILQTLMARPRIAFSRAQILESAYPDNLHVSDRTIDSHIRNIRAKVKMAGCSDGIETVHGIGFRLGSCRA